MKLTESNIDDMNEKELKAVLKSLILHLEIKERKLNKIKEILGEKEK